MDDNLNSNFHPLEDADSRSRHLDVLNRIRQNEDDVSSFEQDHRRLKHHHHHHDKDSVDSLESTQEEIYWANERKKKEKASEKSAKKHRKKMKLLAEGNSGILADSVHGLMIDAGSTGSRLHVYEWAPRVLSDPKDVSAAVAGNYLSVPGTESRWTDRLRPGLDSFASINDGHELRVAIEDYLRPLIEFATTILDSKRDDFGNYPIFLRATAGMRILNSKDRARVMEAVRDVLSDESFSPFGFVAEQARVISGEEEAIFDWTSVNFLLGTLIQQSEGQGTVVRPNLTHGALDLGGGSTQIGFYEPHEDVMSNLFKLQIGQAKHWNLYAHSFLFYGINEAINRFNAHLLANKTAEERLIDGVHNPCLPVGAEQSIRSDINVDANGLEYWSSNHRNVSDDAMYAIVHNKPHEGDMELCMEMAKALLHLEQNDWCDFSHKGDCSFAGVYQPALPSRNPNFGDFLAFSNYYHVWQFLRLPDRATIAELEKATRYACSLNKVELISFNDGNVHEDELDSYCFRSVYVYQLLKNGYGFRDDDTIRAVRVIDGHKVGWASGAMLYEINAMPWEYIESHHKRHYKSDNIYHEHRNFEIKLLTVAFFGIFGLISVLLLLLRQRRQQSQLQVQHEYLLRERKGMKGYESL